MHFPGVPMFSYGCPIVFPRFHHGFSHPFPPFHHRRGSKSQVSREVAVEAPAPVETKELLVPKLRGQQVLHAIEPGATSLETHWWDVHWFPIYIYIHIHIYIYIYIYYIYIIYIYIYIYIYYIYIYILCMYIYIYIKQIA